MSEEQNGLPPRWERSTLSEVFDRLQYGYTAKATDSEVGPKFLRITDLQENGVDWSRVPYCPASGSDAEKYRLFDGDFVFARSGSIEKAWRVTEPPIAVFASYLIRGRPLHPAVGPWLSHFIRSHEYLDQIGAAGAGIGMKNVNAKKLGAVRFPLAPTKSRERIVAKIEALQLHSEAAKEALDAIPPLLEKFRQSVLAAAFRGDLTKAWRAANPDVEPAASVTARTSVPPRPSRYNSRSKALQVGVASLAVGNPMSAAPNGWAWVPLVDVARLESGHTPSRRHPEWWGGDVRWIGIPDAREHHGQTIMETKQRTNPDGLANSAARLLPAGTVCLSRTASVGYVVVMGRDMATSQDFVNWTCTDAIDPEWLKYLFMAEKRALWRFSKGTTHSTIYFPEVLSFHVCLPPVAEQRATVAAVKERLAFADSVQNAVEAASKVSGSINQSMLAMAFRGELVPQVPSDEPASVLLERIRAEREATEAENPKKKQGRGRRRASAEG